MKKAEIALLMDTAEELQIMRSAARVLDKFGVPYKLELLHSHLGPQKAVEYASNAMENGLKVLVAGATGAAHLPGILAASTPLPVIGVPIELKTVNLHGQDAIYSMLQMPTGVPVATMALNNAENAAIFALQMLGAHHPSYLELVEAYQKNQQKAAEEMAERLKKEGYEQLST